MIENIKLRKSILYIFLITAIGAVFRIYHLGFKPLWLDEAVIYWISESGSIKEIITQNALRNSTPPLFPILISFITTLSDSEEFLRLISVLAGIASIPAIYFFARELINKYPALILTVLVSVAPTQIKYSQEVREYSLTFLLTILILLFFVRYLKQLKVKDLIMMTIFMIIGILTQYGLSLLIIGLNIIYLYYLIFSKEKQKERLLRWISSQALTLGAAIFVLLVSLRGQSRFFAASGSSSHYLYNAYWNGTVRGLYIFAFKNTYELFKFAFSSNMFIALTIIGFIFLIINIKKLSTPFLLFTVPMTITFFLAVLGFYPYHGDRQDIFLTPMIYMLAGFGINHLWNLDKKRWTAIILFSLPIIAGIVQSWNYLNFPGAENIIPIVEKLQESINEDDHIYVYYGAKPAFDYYYRDYDEVKISYGTSNRGEVNEYYKEIDNLFGQGNPVWFVFSHCWQNECNLIKNHISKNYNGEIIVKENNAFLLYGNQ